MFNLFHVCILKIVILVNIYYTNVALIKGLSLLGWKLKRYGYEFGSGQTLYLRQKNIHIDE